MGRDAAVPTGKQWKVKTLASRYRTTMVPLMPNIL